MESVLDLTEKSTELVGDPLSAAKSFFSVAFESKVADMFNKKYVKQQLYLYLVDEHSGLPVFDPTGVYPITIDVNDTTLAAKHLPLMRVGVQAMALANGAAGILCCLVFCLCCVVLSCVYVCVCSCACACACACVLLFVLCCVVLCCIF